MVREEKGTQTQNFRVRISSVGVGVFHVKGWGAKISVCPSKPMETKLFGPGAPEKFEKIVRVQFLSPKWVVLLQEVQIGLLGCPSFLGRT